MFFESVANVVYEGSKSCEGHGLSTTHHHFSEEKVVMGS